MHGLPAANDGTTPQQEQQEQQEGKNKRTSKPQHTNHLATKQTCQLPANLAQPCAFRLRISSFSFSFSSSHANPQKTRAARPEALPIRRISA